MSAMTWLAYIGPGVGPIGWSNRPLEFAMIAALGALVLRWWVLFRQERLKSEWRCLGLPAALARAAQRPWPPGAR
jgi:hypothetical protein